jgi:S-adenosylmethionine decarboxylase
MIHKPTGKHLIIDIWGEINSLPFWNMEEAAHALKDGVWATGATVLGERWHHFGEGFGYTGVIILSESHLSCHTYNEFGQAMIDIFTCGDCDPTKALPDILSFYKPFKYTTNLFDRGVEKNS